MPFLCRWPAKVPAGTVDSQSVLGAVDMMPTLCEAAGVPLPEDHQLEGESVMDALTGDTHRREKALIWEFACHPMFGHVINKSPTLAIRRDRYKLLLNPERDRVELYDLTAEQTELANIADDHPDLVTQLSAEVMAWKERCPENVRDLKAGSNYYRWPGEKLWGVL
jgi:N-acetylgalactosamine-6-sulfatase